MDFPKIGQKGRIHIFFNQGMDGKKGWGGVIWADQENLQNFLDFFRRKKKLK